MENKVAYTRPLSGSQMQIQSIQNTKISQEGRSHRRYHESPWNHCKKKRKNHTHTLVKESTKGFHLRILLFFCFHKLIVSRLTLDKTDSWHHLLDIAMLQVWDLAACEVSQVGYSTVPSFWLGLRFQCPIYNAICYLLLFIISYARDCTCIYFYKPVYVLSPIADVCHFFPILR